MGRDNVPALLATFHAASLSSDVACVCDGATVPRGPIVFSA